MSVAGHDPTIAAEAAEIAARAEAELAQLVDISSPSGDIPGAEAALELCASLLPDGRRRAARGLLHGRQRARPDRHGHAAPARAACCCSATSTRSSATTPTSRCATEGERLYGTGTADMKGGDILALGVARALARRPEDFAELAVLMVTDEEWRVAPFVHAARPFAGYDACLCFEAGQLTPDGDEAVVVKRKAAGTLRVLATGRASHSGSAPDRGRNALLALARTADAVARLHDPAGARPAQRGPDGDALGRRVQHRSGRRRADLRSALAPAGGV